MPSNVLNAGIFDELIHSAGLWVPAALPSSWREQVSKATFIARGCSTFNDYVLLSNEIACTPGSYDLEESYDTANQADDHLMVSVEGVLMPNFSKSFKRRRTVTYDRKGYRNPEKAAYFSTLVSKCPPVPFHVDPSSHCFFLEEWIRAAAEAAFPKPRFVKKSEILADDTFDFILARGRLRKRFRSAGRDISKMLNKTIAHWVFRAWASAVSLVPQPLIEFSYDFRNRCFDRCMSSLAIDAWTERIRISFDRDLEVYIDEKNQKLDAAASKVDTRVLYSILKPIYKKTQNGAAVVLDKSGCMTSSLRETKAAISDHFASLLCGQRTSMSRLIQKDREDNCATASDLIIDRVDWNLIPSVSKVAQTFAHLQPLVGLSEDRNGSEIFKAAPLACAKALHPLIVKSALALQPPIQWKGGHLFEVYKGKGTTCDIGSYRDVTICAAASKSLSKPMREQGISTLGRLSASTQFGGGLNGGSTEFAHLYLVATMDVAKMRGLSYGGLFVDLQTAFASIARLLAFPFPSSMDGFAAKLFHHGFARDEVHEIIEGLMAYEHWTANGGSKHFLAMLSKLHNNSWFAVEGISGCVSTQSGSLAGNSLGDFVFLLAFSRVLSAVELELSRAGLLFEMSCEASYSLRTGTGGENVRLGPAGYVDDVVQPVIAPASIIIEQMCLCAAIYNEVFARYGLTINFKKGKTEALFRFHGKGAKSARHKLFYEHNGQLTFAFKGKSIPLIATSTYKHVGTITCSTDTMQPEITSKLSGMNATFKALKPTFLTRSAISVDKRLLLAQSVLMSKGLFQAGTWPSLYTAELARVHKSIMKIYSSIFGAGNQERISHATISKNESFVAPAIIISFLRISLFIRVCMKAPPQFLNMLSCAMGGSRSWLHSVANDLKYMVAHSSSFAAYSASILPDWVAVIRKNPRKFKQCLINATRERSVNDNSAWASTKKLREIDSTFLCHVCTYSCHTRQQLSLHCFRAHGICRHMREYVDTDYCPVCLQFFQSRIKVINHLEEKSRRCLAVITACFRPLPKEISCAHDADDAATARALVRGGRRRHFSETPSSRMSGPLIRAAYVAGLSHASLLRTGARVDDDMLDKLVCP
jgi:hypothetical protein